VVISVNNDEDVRLLLGRAREELLSTEREVVLGVDAKHHNDNLLPACEGTRSLDRVAVQTGNIDERDASDPVVEERCAVRAGVQNVELECVIGWELGLRVILERLDLIDPRTINADGFVQSDDATLSSLIAWTSPTPSFSSGSWTSQMIEVRRGEEGRWRG
jgi:hypothetical protein